MCLILALVCVSGCSVVGLGLGTFADRQAERFKRPDSDALREACGRPVCLRLRDGSTATGRLARVEVGPESLLVLHAPPPERIAVESGAEGDSIRVPLRDVVQISAEYNTRTPAFVVLGSMADVVIITAILAHQSTPFHPALH